MTKAAPKKKASPARATARPPSARASTPAEDSRLRVGLAGLAPMHAVGLESLFHGDPKIAMVQGDILELLRDPVLSVMIIGASSDAALKQLIATVRLYRNDVRMIVLSSVRSEEDILNVIAAGAKGHIHEAATVAELQQAIQIVASGSVWAPRRVLSTLIEKLSVVVPAKGSMGGPLTKREREVLELLIAGHPNKEIARALNINDQTVKAYVGKLMRKVGVSSRTALTMHAVENAWLDTS